MAKKKLLRFNLSNNLNSENENTKEFFLKFVKAKKLQYESSVYTIHKNETTVQKIVLPDVIKIK